MSVRVIFLWKNCIENQNFKLKQFSIPAFAGRQAKFFQNSTRTDILCYRDSVSKKKVSFWPMELLVICFF